MMIKLWDSQRRIKTNLLEIAFDKGEYKTTIHQRKCIMNKKCQTSVEMLSIICILQECSSYDKAWAPKDDTIPAYVYCRSP